MISWSEGLFILIFLFFLIKGFIRGGIKEWTGAVVCLLALTLPGIIFLPLSSGQLFQRWDDIWISPFVFFGLSLLILILGFLGAEAIRRIRKTEEISLPWISRLSGGVAGLLQGCFILIIITLFLEMQTLFSLDKLYWLPNRFRDLILYWIPLA